MKGLSDSQVCVRFSFAYQETELNIFGVQVKPTSLGFFFSFLIGYLRFIVGDVTGDATFKNSR
jgi:hypothetical protein